MFFSLGLLGQTTTTKQQQNNNKATTKQQPKQPFWAQKGPLQNRPKKAKKSPPKYDLPGLKKR